MRWMIWPRQYGKTHRILDWWMRDPENRVVLCQNEEIARVHRRKVEEWYVARDHHNRQWFARLSRDNIMSYRSWYNAGRGRNPKQIALDGDKLVINALEQAFCHGVHSLEIIAETGRNEEPDPCIENQSRARHEEMRQQYGRLHEPGWDPGVC